MKIAENELYQTNGIHVYVLCLNSCYFLAGFSSLMRRGGGGTIKLKVLFSKSIFYLNEMSKLRIL